MTRLVQVFDVFDSILPRESLTLDDENLGSFGSFTPELHIPNTPSSAGSLESGSSSAQHNRYEVNTIIR